MANFDKPRTADGYNAVVTESCERTLLTLLGSLGTLKDTIRLVGGLVPRYLVPAGSADVPPHAGTTDVDIVLNLALMAEGEAYAPLADQLRRSGFQTCVNEKGNAVHWQWSRKVSDNIYVVVEFLRDAGGARPSSTPGISGEGVHALAIPHAGIVHDWYASTTIRGQLLDERGFSEETVRYADITAFVILKALAFLARTENKDAADLIYVLQHAGPLEQTVDLFVARYRSGQHTAALDDGLEALRSRFCDDKYSPGIEKAGPIAYASFYHDRGNDKEAHARACLYASGLVQNLWSSIRENLNV